MSGADYPAGTRLILVGYGGGEWPVEVIGHTVLPCELVVRWTGLTPSLDEKNTVCLDHLREVRPVTDAVGLPAHG